MLKILRNLNQPESWDDIIPHLKKNGFSNHLRNLETTSPAFVALRKEADGIKTEVNNNSIQLASLQVSPRIFIASIGILLSAIAFSLIGPLFNLRSAEEYNFTIPWVFILPRKSNFVSKFLELIIFLLSLVWVFLPLYLIYVQVSIDSPLLKFGTPVKFASSLGILFSSYIFLNISLELKKIRNT